ncbi:MAG: hypothetical protein CW338_06590 [Clostridiales bacterium]|nr:hypothetical protein [Clostridiales bacterium]
MKTEMKETVLNETEMMNVTGGNGILPEEPDELKQIKNQILADPEKPGVTVNIGDNTEGFIGEFVKQVRNERNIVNA